MNKLFKMFFMLVPAICFAIAILLLTDFTYNKLYESSPIFNLLLSSSDNITQNMELGHDLIEPSELPNGIEYTDKEFEVIRYGEQWATLNIDGWNTKDIPVYYGDSDDILAKGAGQWNGSFFCGFNKNCVLSAHVMTWFYEIEDTEVGTEVLMQTKYGTYKYEVTDKFVFEETKAETLWADYGGDTLFLYTCYPRSNGLQRTRQRCALVCSLREGLLYENKYEK